MNVAILVINCVAVAVQWLALANMIRIRRYVRRGARVRRYVRTR